MAKFQKDARLMEYKDMISQLNMTVKSQNEIILSLRDTIASNQEQIEYLTKKLFDTSSEKTKNLEGQYNLFDEAEQEAVSTDEIEIAESVPVKEHTRKAKSRQADVFKDVPSRDESYRFPKTRSFALIVVLK